MVCVAPDQLHIDIKELRPVFHEAINVCLFCGCRNEIGDVGHGQRKKRS